jgi:hypothetical protein
MALANNCKTETCDRKDNWIYSLCLYNDAVSTAHYTASNIKMTVNNELEKMWKEAVVAYLRHSCNKPGKTDRTETNLSRAVGVPADIRIMHLLNTVRSITGWVTLLSDSRIGNEVKAKSIL